MQTRQYQKSDVFSRLLSVFLIAAIIPALLSGCEERDPQIPDQLPTEGPSEQISDPLPTEEPSEQIINLFPTENLSGQIFLYGEVHSDERMLEEEFQLWYAYYHEAGMRHLFVELPYYTAEFLNLWMHSEDDSILNQIYRDIQGTAADTQATRTFYQRIKEDCPETVFHGTDVGHQYDTTGARYLAYLESAGEKDSEAYALAQETITQGRRFYRNSDKGLDDSEYRENKMVENFIREFDKLGGENIMGIYGAAHTVLDSLNFTGTAPSMATQLAEYYGTALHAEDLARPIRTDTMEVGGKTYEASYFGEQDLTSFSTVYQSREFWRLENAYDNFKDCPVIGQVLPYNNYPMQIKTGQIFVINYTKTDGSVERRYYRSDGHTWDNLPTTVEIAISEHLSLLLQPIRTDTMEVGGKTYEASYFGEMDMTSFSTEYQFREYWRLENAYDDFKGCPANGDGLPYNTYPSNYPMQIEVGQVIVIDYTKTDGTVVRRYYRSDGHIWSGFPVTEEFTIP